jgi:AraC-like DNA-binding protein
VRRVLRSMVLSGTASAEQVAFMFATSRRSLHRALAADGTSLQLLVNETRFEVARQLLDESDMPAGEIAAALQYSDASAFSRAFKEWSGTSPREWRRSIRSARTTRGKR